MGQDFVARKAAKKHRKRAARDAESGRKRSKKRSRDFEAAVPCDADDDGLTAPTAEQLKRRRKKGSNVSLRISRALCYAPPTLTPDDLAWDGTEEGGDASRGAYGYAGAAAAAAAGDDGDEFAGFKEAGYDSDVEEALAKTPQQQQQQQPKKKKQPGQQVKFSTAVNLLSSATTAKLATKADQQQQQLQQQQQRGQEQAQQHEQLDAAVAAAPALQALVAAGGLPPLLPRCMAKLGFSEPTPIQAACWAPASAGNDVLGHAEPGSGKTLAFLLPALAHIVSSSQAGSATAAAIQPAALILLPSRELAQQVHSQAAALFGVTGVSSTVVFGGVPKQQQVALLQQRRPQLLVATPGRLLDLVDGGVLDLSCTRLVVLDEADKMLSVGFEPQLQRLQGMLLAASSQAAAATAVAAAGSEQPEGRKAKKQQRQQKQAAAAAAAGPGKPQVLMFSATLPPAVRQTAAAWLTQGCPVISVSAAGADCISKTITQVVQVCAEHKKPAKLLKHLAAIKEAAAGARNPPRVLVFANRIKTVVFVQRTLTEAGYRSVMLHGKRSQGERDAAVADFKAGKAQVLVASDVASRGLDIRGLPYVVNYDLPSNLEAYVHRVGRTGRLASAGHAFSFFTRPLARLAAPLISLLQAHGQAIDPNLMQLAEAWQQAEAALAAQGKSAAAAAAAAALEGDADDEEEQEEQGPARLAVVAEDLLEGLGGSSKASKQQQLLQQPQKLRKSSKQAGDAVMVPQGKSGTEAAAAPAAPFLPSPRFAGARPGYYFGKGSRGVGYYLDAMQQDSGVSARASKAGKQQQQQRALQHVLKQQQQQQPARRQEAKPQAASKKASNSSSSSLPPLPGLAAKRKLPAFAAGADLSDDDAGRALSGSGSDSDGDGGPPQRGAAAGAGGGKRKALPGRLRKQLAKRAAAKAGSGVTKARRQQRTA